MVRHLINTRDFSKVEIENLLIRAEEFLDEKQRDILNGHIVINIFFENSTRTRSSFEVASKRLGALVVNLDVDSSSTKKGETLHDTAMNLDAMGPSAIVIRHSHSGVPNILSEYLNCSIINGGDGSHAHPTQALLDLFTIKKNLKNIEGKKIAIVGDIKSSRVANSNIELLSRFGMEVILVAPPHFLGTRRERSVMNLRDVIDEVDVVMALRTQVERHKNQIYGSLKDYAQDYCITKDIFGDRDILLLHPGPVNRNIDIDDEMLNDSRCRVLEQVKNGVAMRMAVLEKLIRG